MSTFPRPVVVVSRCLEFSACRYNGQLVTDKFIQALKPFVRFKPVCPEVDIGMGVPREPIRLVGDETNLRLIQAATGIDWTTKMQRFSKKFTAKTTNVDGFILKSRSPSCGIKDTKIFPQVENSPSTGRGAGMFGAEILNSFQGLAVEDEGRLTNYKIREHFLTHLFTLAAFRELKKAPSMRKLVDFQATNKLLFMAYNQNVMRQMGKVVANLEKRPLAEVVATYEGLLLQMFVKQARYTSHVNVLEHAYGYFRKELSDREKSHWREMLQKYRDEKVPLSALLAIMRSWIARFGQEYLEQQRYFEPYPEALVALSDSGKGRLP